MADEAHKAEWRITIYEESMRLLEKEEDHSAKVVACHYVQQRKEGLNHASAQSATRAVSGRILEGLSSTESHKALHDGLILGEDTWLAAMDIL